MVNDLDAKGEGAISYEEFLHSCFLSYIYLKEYKLRGLCEQADTEKRGGLTIAQVKHILMASPEFSFPEDALDRIFQQELKVDITQVDPDTLIDYNQFLVSLRKELKIE